MKYMKRIFFQLLTALILSLTSSSHAAFTVVRTYDATSANNSVDQNATPALTVSAFTPTVAQAYDQLRGGVIDFDTGDVDSFNTFFANFGVNRTILFTRLNGGWIRGVSTTGAISSSGLLFGGNAHFQLGPVLDATTSLPLNERITQFGVTIVDRNDQDLPITATATYYNYLTQTSDNLPVVSITILRSNTNLYDTFFGFAAPADSYLTEVNFSSTSSDIAFDDLGFVTSAVLEPGVWGLFLVITVCGIYSLQKMPL